MIQKLIKKIQQTGAPIVVGLDPMLSYIPGHILKEAFAQYGETPEGAAEAVWRFNKEIVDAVYDLVPAVKPQIAMYEQFGIEGLKAYMKKIWSSSGTSSAGISARLQRPMRRLILERFRSGRTPMHPLMRISRRSTPISALMVLSLSWMSAGNTKRASSFW